MSDFTGFIGSSVLPAATWTKIGNVTPATGDMFTAIVSTLYSPGFLTRQLNDAPSAVFTKNDDGIMELTGGPDDDTIIYIAVMPGDVDTSVRANVQPYLRTGRYALAAGTPREHTGLMIPAGWYVYAYSSKADTTVTVFGVEGRPTRFKRDPI